MKKLGTLILSGVVVSGLLLANPMQIQAAGVVKRGDQGETVTQLQDALADEGHFTFGRSTGYFGTITEDAVIDYQKSNGLQVDGKAGPETLGSLGLTDGSSGSTGTGSTASSDDVLKLGSRGDMVSTLQQKLKNEGYYTYSEITGYYGPITQKAVIAYQKAKGLPQTGVAASMTLDALGMTGGSTEASPEDTSSGSGSLRVGDRNDEVVKVQTILRDKGYFRTNVTGYFGSITEAAVIAFQKDYGIDPIGVVGPQTRAALFGSGSSSNSNANSSNSAAEPEDNSGSNPAPSAAASNIVAYAKQFMGTPYVYGGNGPNAFDCSGFVKYVFANAGIGLSRTATAQSGDGVAVSRSNLQTGDLIFFDTISGNSKPIDHVGIYIGDGQFIHCSTSKGVTISDLSSGYYSRNYTCATRIQ